MTINEIASMAGVSRATVSRYLNQGYVSEEKREAIRKVIEKTGYEPSTQAQNLRKKVTKLIGVIIPKIQSESVSRMVSGISSVLSGRGYQLLLANTQNDEKEELKYLKIFRKNQVDGIIFMGTIFSKEHDRLMKESDVPIVVVGQQVQDFSCVFQDDYHAAYDAALRLLEQGKKIGYIGVTKRDKAAGEDREKGFFNALEEKHVEIAPEKMLTAEFGVKSGYEKAKELLTAHPDTDSIFCATDSIAAGALKFLHEAGIKVPEQVQLIGFGDTEMGSVVSPAITTVHFPYKTSGMEAARMLLDILDTDIDLRKELKMGYRIVENQSLR